MSHPQRTAKSTSNSMFDLIDTGPATARTALPFRHA
jgi:hypothetical protein